MLFVGTSDKPVTINQAAMKTILNTGLFLLGFILIQFCGVFTIAGIRSLGNDEEFTPALFIGCGLGILLAIVFVSGFKHIWVMSETPSLTEEEHPPGTWKSE